MISLMTSSATLRELEKGELKTAMPDEAAATRSTWLVPMQKQPMARSCRTSERSEGGRCGRGEPRNEKERRRRKERAQSQLHAPLEPPRTPTFVALSITFLVIFVLLLIPIA